VSVQAAGLGLMIWIIVQVLIVGLNSWLQPLYFGLGFAILLMTLTPAVKRYIRLPANNGGGHSRQ
jgi:hypothetical protein